MQRFLVIAGLASPWLSQWAWLRWIGRLPGDLHVERGGFSFHFPLMTSIVASIAVSLLPWLLRK